jgi:hypothetical protein
MSAMTSPPSPQLALDADQQRLYDDVVATAAGHRGDYATVLVAYAKAGNDPQDMEAVRSALFGSHRPTSSAAVQSLVVGLLAMFACPIPFMGVYAIWAGRRGMAEARTGIKSGQGFAVAGQILAGINTAFWAAVAIVLLIGAIARQ